MALADLEARIASAVEAVAPGVAAVDAVRLGGRWRGAGFAAPSQATAVVTDRAGYLITNQHVVEGAAHLAVRLADGRELPAEVVGGDEVTDVALVKVDAHDLPAARLGDSEALRVGQFVLAVGHALGLPGGPTVSLGVVSALARPLPGTDFVFEGLVQTDAAINPGNSGGPLVDLSGSVVGINTAMVPFAQGVGFALPIHAAVRITDELRRTGRVVRPWMGVQVAELSPPLARQVGAAPRSGLLVAEVVPRSPAHRAGLRPGDIVQAVGPFEVRTVRELLEALAKFPVGSDVVIAYVRRSERRSVSVPLQESPEVLAPAG
ncbi:MAG TPA: trypsin-like peptidase domain-containing protein [Thermoplasmata archaeon]|nr:trypsin-like peptidase domain-containing protein [Thermoplasmata archaeon]